MSLPIANFMRCELRIPTVLLLTTVPLCLQGLKLAQKDSGHHSTVYVKNCCVSCKSQQEKSQELWHKVLTVGVRHIGIHFGCTDPLTVVPEDGSFTFI